MYWIAKLKVNDVVVSVYIDGVDTTEAAMNIKQYANEQKVFWGRKGYDVISIRELTSKEVLEMMRFVPQTLEQIKGIKYKIKE